MNNHRLFALQTRLPNEIIVCTYMNSDVVRNLVYRCASEHLFWLFVGAKDQSEVQIQYDLQVFLLVRRPDELIADQVLAVLTAWAL